MQKLDSSTDSSKKSPNTLIHKKYLIFKNIALFAFGFVSLNSHSKRLYGIICLREACHLLYKLNNSSHIDNQNRIEHLHVPSIKRR